jgi:hypothetical protein
MSAVAQSEHSMSRRPIQLQYDRPNGRVRATQVQCSTNGAGVAKMENIFFEFVRD